MKKIIALIIVILALAGCSQSEPEFIKIGFIGPLSEGPALWGQASLNMIELAIQDINSNGGINNKQIELIIEDGKCRSQTAVTAANKLLKIDNVKFILGGHCSPETIAIVPIIEDNNAFLLASVTSADDAVKKSKYAFRTSPQTLEQAQRISEKAYGKYEYKKIALITEDAAYARSFTQDIKLTFQGNILEEFDFIPGERDFKSGLIKIKAKNPDAIWISPQSPTSAILLLKQLKELNMDNIPVFGNSIFISKNVGTKSGLLSEKAFTVIPFADPNDSGLVKIQERYQEKYGGPIPYNLYYISSTYDAMQMLAESIEKCGENVDCVQESFDILEDYQGISGKFTFDKDGNPLFDSWKEMTIKNNKEFLIN